MMDTARLGSSFIVGHISLEKKSLGNRFISKQEQAKHKLKATKSYVRIYFE